jgi:hypothetical protein
MRTRFSSIICSNPPRPVLRTAVSSSKNNRNFGLSLPFEMINEPFRDEKNYDVHDQDAALVMRNVANIDFAECRTISERSSETSKTKKCRIRSKT